MALWGKTDTAGDAPGYLNTTDAANSAFADSDVVCVQICGDLA